MTEHPFTGLPPREKEPSNARAFLTWLHQTSLQTGIAPKRLNRTVANGIVIAALQRSLHDDDLPLFLIKGGTYRTTARPSSASIE